MSTTYRSRRAAFGIAAVLAGALATPLAVTAEEQALAVAPVAPSWGETSGYDAIEANRAAASTLLAGDPSWDATSGYDAVERIRASASAMLVPSAYPPQVSPEVRWAPAREIAADLACGRGGQRAADLAAAQAWDATNGYGAVEAIRADQ